MKNLNIKINSRVATSSIIQKPLIGRRLTNHCSYKRWAVITGKHKKKQIKKRNTQLLIACSMYQDHTQQDNNDLTTIAIFVLAEFDVKMKCIAEDLHIINMSTSLYQ